MPEPAAARTTPRARGNGCAPWARETNARLQSLADQGAGLGVRVRRVDVVAALPAEAKDAFDEVLRTAQLVESEIAQARSIAAGSELSARQQRDSMLANARAAAAEAQTLAVTRMASAPALDQGERRAMGVRLMLSIVAMSLGVQAMAPDQYDVAQLLAGGAALMVAVPALMAAWHSLLPLVMTVGHILEERSLVGSAEAIRALTRLTRAKARRVGIDGVLEEVWSTALQVGDLLELRAGDQCGRGGRAWTPPPSPARACRRTWRRGRRCSAARSL